MDRPPYLTVVDSDVQPNDDEFTPLPWYSWDERPASLVLDQDECATAIHLAKGDLDRAAALLKVPHIRLARLIRQSPRLQRIQQESLDTALAKAASIPLRTLFNPNSDQRALEWASTKVLASRLAIGHPLSPAPPATSAASLTVNPQSRSIVFRWRTDADDDPPDDVA